MHHEIMKLINKITNFSHMKLILRIEIDCANCANKIEDVIKKIEGIDSCTISFMTQKMILEVKDDIDRDSLLKEIKKKGKRIDSDFEVYF